MFGICRKAREVTKMIPRGYAVAVMMLANLALSITMRSASSPAVNEAAAFFERRTFHKLQPHCLCENLKVLMDSLWENKYSRGYFLIFSSSYSVILSSPRPLFSVPLFFHLLVFSSFCPRISHRFACLLLLVICRD